MKSSISFCLFVWLLLVAISLTGTNALRGGDMMKRTRRLQELGVQPVSDTEVINFETQEDATTEDTTTSTDSETNTETQEDATIEDTTTSTDSETNTETTPQQTSTVSENDNTTTTTPITESNTPPSSSSTTTTTTTTTAPTTTDTNTPPSSTSASTLPSTTPTTVPPVNTGDITTPSQEITSPVNSNSMNQALIDAQRANANTGDKVAPLLRSFTCDRATVSVIGIKSSVRCVAEAYDENAGVEYIYGAFYNTQGTRKIPFYFSEKSKIDSDPNTMISTYALNIPIPKGSDNGIWTLGIEGSYPSRFINLEVGDYEGNVHVVTQEDIQIIGRDNVQSSLTILSDPNPSYFLSPTQVISDGPIVKSIYCQDDSITLTSSIIFRCFARIKPDAFGIKKAEATYVGPNGESNIPFVFDGETGFLREEDDGTIILYGEQYIPAYINAGKYDIKTEGALRVTATSNGGVLRATKAEDIEYAPSLLISSSRRDILPPEIISFKCNQGKEKAIELPEKAGETVQLKCTLDIMDRMSGIQSASFEFVDPSKRQVTSFTYAPPARGLNYNHELYNDLRLTLDDTVYFDKDARRGAYILRGATVVDNAGNMKSYMTSQLDDEYIQTYFMVDVPEELISNEKTQSNVTSPASATVVNIYFAVATFLGGIALQMFMLY